jgi:hypothetical protein
MPTLKTKCAAALLALGDIPHEDAKKMTSDQIISLYHYDHHPRRKAEGGDDHPSNFTPRLIADHRRKTAEFDLPEIAKNKRVRAKYERHLERMRAK